MDVLLWILAAVCVGAGIAGVVVPVLPGAPLVWLGLLFAAWADGFTRVSGWTLAFLAVLAASTVVIDLVAGALGAKRVKASGWEIAAPRWGRSSACSSVCRASSSGRSSARWPASS